MSSQPPDGRHVTDFAEFLRTTWEPKDERSETSAAGVLAPDIFRS